MRKDLLKALILPALSLPAGLYLKPNPAGNGVVAELEGECVGTFELLAANAFGEGTVGFDAPMTTATLGTTELDDDGMRLVPHRPGQLVIQQYFTELASATPDYGALARELAEAGRAYLAQMSSGVTEMRVTSPEPKDAGEEYKRVTTILLAGWYVMGGTLLRFEVRREEEKRKLQLFVATSTGPGVSRPNMHDALFIGFVTAVPRSVPQWNANAVERFVATLLSRAKAS